jgi:hypothetical protein
MTRRLYPVVLAVTMLLATPSGASAHKIAITLEITERYAVVAPTGTRVLLPPRRTSRQPKRRTMSFDIYLPEPGVPEPSTSARDRQIARSHQALNRR